MSRIRPYLGLLASRRGLRPYGGLAVRLSRRSVAGLSATGRPWVKLRMTPRRGAGHGLLWLVVLGALLWWALS